MTVGRLDKLLRISLESRTVDEFPFGEAFKQWASVKSRRILQ